MQAAWLLGFETKRRNTSPSSRPRRNSTATVNGACLAAAILAMSACVADDVSYSTYASAVYSPPAGTLPPAPADAIPCPADYDGDGFTDFALKGSNGIWYIDVAKNHLISGVDPINTVIGTTINGFGARWDFAYRGYGDNNSFPVPADYDGDGHVDLAVRDISGTWYIDYYSNGFTGWDWWRGYGGASATPAPGDYDRDGKTDIAVKDVNGRWLIDLAYSGGFGGWDNYPGFGGYGGSQSVPVPADYDGDGCTDLSVKDPNVTASGTIGTWYIDYARSGCAPGSLSGFGAWDWPWYSGYGDSTAIPVPADYDGDGHADLAIKGSSNGVWLIDYAWDGFGFWNNFPGYGGYGGASKAIPGHYDLNRDPNLDKRLDLSVSDGSFYVDLVSNGYNNGWDIVPGTTSTYVDNGNRVIVETDKPYINSVKVYPPDSQTALSPGSPLTIGVRYTLEIYVNAGVFTFEAAPEINTALQINPVWQVPGSLNINNRMPPQTFFIEAGHTIRYAFTCSQQGTFPIGFKMRSSYLSQLGERAFNPDYGINVRCVRGVDPITNSEAVGLYGRVSVRHPDYFTPGAGVYQATVQISKPGAATIPPILTDVNGNWRYPTASGGPFRIEVTKANFSKTIAVNVNVPNGASTRVDLPLEEPFPNLAAAGMPYTLYVDYSRGRTLLHNIEINSAVAKIDLVRALTNASGQIKTMVKLAQENLGSNALVLINGGYFRHPDGKPHWYKYALGYEPHDAMPNNIPSYVAEDGVTVLQTANYSPLFTIKGTGIKQQFGILQVPENFLSGTGGWGINSLGHPIWDPAAPFGVSDVDYALQCDPLLVMNNRIPFRGILDAVRDPYAVSHARTAVGIIPSSKGTTVHFVVADAEGIDGGNGATINQLGAFFRDTLKVSGVNARAMSFDGGLSSELVLRGASGPRRMNTIAYEGLAWDHGYGPNPNSIGDGVDGGPGSVGNYFVAWGQ